MCWRSKTFRKTNGIKDSERAFGKKTLPFFDETDRNLFPIKRFGPSPTAYALQKTWVNPDSVVQEKVSSIERFSEKTSDAPGVGSYFQAEEQQIPHGFRYTVSSFRPRKEPFNTPGPGAYDPQLIKPKTSSEQKVGKKRPKFKSLSVPHEKRVNPAKKVEEYSPSACDYYVNHDILTGLTRSSISRNIRTKVESWDYNPLRDTPGVGQYEVKEQRKVPLGIISSNPRFKQDKMENSTPSEFQLQHQGFIKQSHNARYSLVLSKLI